MGDSNLRNCPACCKPVAVPILDYVNGKFFLRCPHCRSHHVLMAESIGEAIANWNKFNSGYVEFDDDEDYPF